MGPYVFMVHTWAFTGVPISKLWGPNMYCTGAWTLRVYIVGAVGYAQQAAEEAAQAASFLPAVGVGPDGRSSIHWICLIPVFQESLPKVAWAPR